MPRTSGTAARRACFAFGFAVVPHALTASVATTRTTTLVLRVRSSRVPVRHPRTVRMPGSSLRPAPRLRCCERAPDRFVVTARPGFAFYEKREETDHDSQRRQPRAAHVARCGRCGSTALVRSGTHRSLDHRWVLGHLRPRRG